MGALTIALAAVTVIAVLSLLVLVTLRRHRCAPGQESPSPPHPQAPAYKQQTQHAEYYRPREMKVSSTPPLAKPEERDPRKQALPHCPLCNAAVGFDDERCPKCRHVLKDI